MPSADDPTIAASLGDGIARLRGERGWSAAELARRAGIGKATLSEIEAGRRNTTLQTLDALTSALGVPLSAPLPDRPPVPIPSDATVSGELVARFADDGATTELYRIRVAAGAPAHQAARAAGLHKVMMLFAGAVAIGLPDGALRLGAGESAQWRADRPHTYAAAGAHDAHGAVLMRYSEGGSTRAR